MRQLWSEQDLAEWWQYAERLLTCSIGFPSDYDLGKPRGKMPGHSIVPNIKIPYYLRPIDRAMVTMPSDHRDILKIKFATSGKTDQERAGKSGKAYSTFKADLCVSYAWLDGWFEAKKI